MTQNVNLITLCPDIINNITYYILNIDWINFCISSKRIYNIINKHDNINRTNNHLYYIEYIIRYYELKRRIIVCTPQINITHKYIINNYDVIMYNKDCNCEYYLNNSSNICKYKSYWLPQYNKNEANNPHYESMIEIFSINYNKKYNFTIMIMQTEIDESELWIPPSHYYIAKYSNINCDFTEDKKIIDYVLRYST